MAIHLQYNKNDIKYNTNNDIIDFYDSKAPYLTKVQSLLDFGEASERESKPKYLSVKSSKPFFNIRFEMGRILNSKKLNLRFPGIDILTIDLEIFGSFLSFSNKLRIFNTEEIGSAFENELGGHCENNENFVWNKSECD